MTTSITFRTDAELKAEVENILEDNGAIRAFMTGSGPTVFAIFDDKNKAEAALKEVEKSRLAPELFLSGPINPEE